MEVYNYPAPFCIVKNFLNEEKLEKVKTELEGLRPHLKSADMTGPARNNSEISVKRKGIFIDEFPNLRGNSGINSIFDKVMDPYFIGEITSKHWIFNYLENSYEKGTLISLYEEGDEYKYHKDKAVMSIIYYLFDGEFEGGDFYLNHVKVPIENNSLIIFPSCVHHAVTPITGKGSRWSVTTFFNLKTDIPKPPENIFKFRNFITVDDYNVIRNIINEGQWSLTGHSSPDPTNPSFWFMNLTHDFFTKTLFERIPHGPWKLQRVYANGQTFGQNGGFHQDSKKPNDWTFLLYLNVIDSRYIDLWGGATEFETKDGRFSQVPEPNLGILFKSDILHRGLSPNRYINEMRVTIAWKLTKA